MKKIAAIFFAGFLAITFLSACAAALQYDKVSLGMSRDEVKKIAGKPVRSQLRLTASANGTMLSVALSA